MLARPQGDARPCVYVAEADFERLSDLAAAFDGPGPELLADELERAILIRADEAPQRFVRLGAVVDYRDLLSGRLRTVCIVPPEKADMDRNRVSVISPVGAALLGLCVGDVFGWTGPDGRARLISVERIGGGDEAA